MTFSGDFQARGTDTAQILLNDHQTIRGLLDRLRGAGSPQAALGTIEQLKGILTVHNAMEENLVYPALAVIGGEKIEPRKLYFETAEADMKLFELDQIAKGMIEADFAAKCETFVKAVTEHMESEERSAIPHLQEKSESAEQRQLTTAVREFRGKFQFAPQAA